MVVEAVPVFNEYFLKEDDRQALFRLGLEKTKVVVAIQQKRCFFDNLFGLKEKKPKDVALVAFVPEKSKRNIRPAEESCFDRIVFYDDSENTLYGLTNYEDVRLPNLHRFVDELVTLVPKEKIALIHMEEASTPEVCRVREKHGLSGAYMSDVDRFSSKKQISEIAENAGIPVAKTVFLDFSTRPNKSQILKKIMAKIQTFPMFAKPNRMAGGQGTTNLENREALERWIDAHLKAEDSSTYLVQEFLTGREISVNLVLLQDGTWKALRVKYNYKDMSNHTAIFEGGPMMTIYRTFENAENGEFPGLEEFTNKVLTAFKPLHPHVMFYQAFQSFDNPRLYYLIELAYRPPHGDPSGHPTYYTCGIHQTTALFLCHMDPKYRPAHDPSWKPKIWSNIYYPFVKGRLISQNPFPQKPQIEGDLKGEWYVKPGEEVPEAKRMTNRIAKMVLESTNKQEQERDLTWIFENWKPDMELAAE
ncbi:hypothetical protein L596_010442 [Steinernema carpocapsae]|uniref:ATP-grasp domain-containing protein n=1 Tax=Steinernema carpocapsae TaxID=34508 RepID=A0A4U5PIX3_STECR|nr:hypothetical protein L596_010442 [Steinernema carpocapsae]